MENNKIDFVITWVDGNDKKWRNVKKKYSPSIGTDDGNNRYRDFNILKYWFRAVDKYAPWVNKVYFVTCGQIPKWLDTECKKLVIVDHKDFIPKKYLPTFSSHTIELNFNNIKGLCEKFVYFNDDMFLNDYVKPCDFFKDDLPCDECVETALLPQGKTPQFSDITANVVFYINKNFKKKDVIKKNPFKYINFKYGINNLRTIVLLPFPKYSLFKNSHICQSFLKSTLDNVWNKETNVLNNTCINKFRSSTDVNQYIFRFWQFTTGKFYPRNSHFGTAFELNNDDNSIAYNSIKNNIYKCVCLNDSDENLNFEKISNELISIYENKFPNKCIFEK